MIGQSIDAMLLPRKPTNPVNSARDKLSSARVMVRARKAAALPSHENSQSLSRPQRSAPNIEGGRVKARVDVVEFMSI